jgi:hypothetical protein
MTETAASVQSRGKMARRALLGGSLPEVAGFMERNEAGDTSLT